MTDWGAFAKACTTAVHPQLTLQLRALRFLLALTDEATRAAVEATAAGLVVSLEPSGNGHGFLMRHGGRVVSISLSGWQFTCTGAAVDIWPPEGDELASAAHGYVKRLVMALFL